MDQPIWAEPLHCSACEEEIASGNIIYVVCVKCALVHFVLDDPHQLTLFELPASSEIH